MKNGEEIYIQLLLNGKPIEKSHTKKIGMAAERFRGNDVLHRRFLKLLASHCIAKDRYGKILEFKSKADMDLFLDACRKMEKQVK
ncbi:MAG: hypothetical protein II992_00250 [Lachnospiraceae bacterium]|nr:hypothetical protein [Lachnospiraceae bacterium]